MRQDEIELNKTMSEAAIALGERIDHLEEKVSLMRVRFYRLVVLIHPLYDGVCVCTRCADQSYYLTSSAPNNKARVRPRLCYDIYVVELNLNQKAFFFVFPK